MTKLEKRNQLRQTINLLVKNLENYPQNERNVIVSNHNCLMDIFYLPMALEEEIISLISARLIYKREKDRREIIEKYLNAMPIEAHGGNKYAKLCLEEALKFLQYGKSVNIFPEGAYVPENKIFKGHTGASRLVFDTKSHGNDVNLIPVSIRAPKTGDLDDYKKKGDSIEITILPAIDYRDSYYNYRNAKTKEERNSLLHKPVDTAMKSIADNLKVPYTDDYIELRKKGNVMFADGSTVDTDIAQEEKFLNQYKEELDNRCRKLLKNM